MADVIIALRTEGEGGLGHMEHDADHRRADRHGLVPAESAVHHPPTRGEVNGVAPVALDEGAGRAHLAGIRSQLRRRVGPYGEVRQAGRLGVAVEDGVVAFEIVERTEQRSLQAPVLGHLGPADQAEVALGAVALLVEVRPKDMAVVEPGRQEGAGREDQGRRFAIARRAVIAQRDDLRGIVGGEMKGPGKIGVGEHGVEIEVLLATADAQDRAQLVRDQRRLEVYLAAVLLAVGAVVGIGADLGLAAR